MNLNTSLIIQLYYLRKTEEEKSLILEVRCKMCYREKTIFLTLLIMLVFVQFSVAQQMGKISGTIIDSETGDPIVGANIFLEETTLGASSDLDGNFVILRVPEGQYSLVVSVIGYTDVRVNKLTIKSGQTKKLDIALKPEILSATEVIEVTARALTNTEASLLKLRQKSVSVSDAISAELIEKNKSSNAADAMKYVTGASVVGNKYVLVRGLGERYSLTQLNGVELPTSDPNKRSFNFDLIPAAIIKNIVTIKTFTPDQPGNFSGGIVNLGTKSYPDNLLIQFSNSISYNVHTTFNDNFLSSSLSETDWLGMDDGLRSLPKQLKDPTLVIPSEIEAERNPEKAKLLNDLTKAFNPELSALTRRAPLNQSYSFALGNQINLANRPFGYLLSLSYKRNATYYENGEVGRWKLTGNVENNDELTNLISLKDKKGTENVYLGGVLNLSFKPHPYHQLQSNLVVSQSGQNEARYLVGRWPEQFLDNPNAFFETRVIHYTQRNLQSYQLKGESVFPKFTDLKIDWKGQLGFSSQDEPDARYFSDNFAHRKFQGRDTVIYSISPSIYPRPARYFRKLNETKRNFDLKFSFPLRFSNQFKAKFMLGGYYQEKSRTFRENLFEYYQGRSIRYQGDPNTFFSFENAGIIDTVNNKFLIGNYIKKSLNALGGDYDGEEFIRAAFCRIDLPLTKNLKVTTGVRFEQTDMTVFDSDTAGYLKTNDWLPSLNINYSLTQNTNLRLSYGHTLARPNFREKAPYASYTFMNDAIFQGNPNLKHSKIDNYDFRWEWFTAPNEIVAFSAFYKYLRNPIERVINLLYTSEGAIITYENVNYARVYGIEFEVRQNLGKFHRLLKNFSLGTNLSLMNSQVKIPDEEYKLIKELNPNAKDTRPLQGQSPYLINVHLDYTHPNWGTNVNVFFNVFGKRLAEVSLGGTPDVYEKPQPMLDISLSQPLISNLILSAQVENLMNTSYKLYQHYKGKDYTRQYYSIGRTISIGIKAKL